MCFKRKFIHFVYSYVANVAFPSCLHRKDQFVFFVSPLFSSSLGARGHAVVVVNESFSDLFGSEEFI